MTISRIIDTVDLRTGGAGEPSMPAVPDAPAARVEDRLVGLEHQPKSCEDRTVPSSP